MKASKFYISLFAISTIVGCGPSKDDLVMMTKLSEAEKAASEELRKFSNGEYVDSGGNAIFSGPEVDLLTMKKSALSRALKNPKPSELVRLCELIEIDAAEFAKYSEMLKASTKDLATQDCTDLIKKCSEYHNDIISRSAKRWREP